MQTKLTVSIDQKIIKQAKKKLQTKQTSLSHLIEDYFKRLLLTTNEHTTDTPIVTELTGIAKAEKPVDEKALITDYLLEKYT